MQRNAKTPAEYLGMIESPQRELIESIRASIFEAVPKIEEIVEYGMLGYPGLANLGAQKQYVALYVAPAVLAEHKANFPGLNCGKSCMRFRNAAQIAPEHLRALLKDVYQFRKENPSEGC